MVRTISIFLWVLLLAAALTGCGGTETEPVTETTAIAIEESATATTETTSASTTTTVVVDPYPNRDDAVALTEEFLDAFYAFDEEAMLATLAPNNKAEEMVLYSQGWAQGANYQIISRQACVFHEGGQFGKVTCDVTVRDDLMKAIGQPEVYVTELYTFYYNDEGITLVEFDADDPSELGAGFEWVFETYPELRDYKEPCWAMFEGGPTPQECVTAVIAALEEYAAR